MDHAKATDSRMGAPRRSRRVAAIAATFAIGFGGVAWAGCGGGEEQSSSEALDALNEEYLDEAATSAEETAEDLQNFDGGEAVEDISEALNESE